MSDDAEWSEWFQHDGKGCPCAGMWVHVIGRGGWEVECRANCTQISNSDHRILPYTGKGPSRWVWSGVPDGLQIIRYRIRKPRALLSLIERARELDDAPQGPVRVKPKVDA